MFPFPVWKLEYTGLKLSAEQMKQLKGWLYISVFLGLVTSCNKNITDDYPQEHTCEKFSGKYLVYDPENDTTYEMSISCKLSEPASEGNDTIIFKNFANEFDFSYRFWSASEDFLLQPAFFFGIKDYNGNRWSISIGSAVDGYIHHDSLPIDFKLSNIAFYMEDSVPYYACEPCVHYAVKQH